MAALRTELARRGLTGFIVPRADRHQNEYLPACEERLAWLTGFTGSAGTAIVLMERAVLFVDGRYTLQAREQVDASLFAIEHLVDTPPERWIESNLTGGDRLGYDPWLHTIEGAERFGKACAAAGAALVAVEPNLIDAIWRDRPPPPLGAVTLHDLRFAGEDRPRKSSPASAPKSQSCAPMLSSSPTRMRSPGPSTFAAPTSRTRRCRSPSRSFRRPAAHRSLSMAASFPTTCAIASKRSPMCASRPISLPRSRRARPAKQTVRLRPGDCRRCARARGHGARRQS